MARRRLTPARPAVPGPAAPVAPAPAPSGLAPSLAPPIAQVAGQSAEAAALRQVSAEWQAARDEGRLVAEIPLAAIAPDHLLRDRMSLDPDDLEMLKASIAAHGQRFPAEVMLLSPVSVSVPGTDADAAGTAPPRYGLISGWRRFRALSALQADTGDARFGRIKAFVRPVEDAATAYTAMVEENEIRVGLSYYERARLVAEATRAGVFDDQSQALRTLFAAASRAKRSKIASFIEIHEALGDVLIFPAEIPERLGLALVSRLREGGKSGLRQALRAASPEDAAAELALLDRLAKGAAGAAGKTAVSRAKQAAGEEIAPGLHLATKRRNRTYSVTLEGPAVDEAFLARLRTFLAGR